MWVARVGLGTAERYFESASQLVARAEGQERPKVNNCIGLALTIVPVPELRLARPRPLPCIMHLSTNYSPIGMLLARHNTKLFTPLVWDRHN